MSDDASEDKFECVWDEEKRASIIKKHGIDFADISRIFHHNIIEDYDSRHSEEEDRWRVLGLLDGKVVFCVYTQREGKRRIITARLGTDTEKMVYFSRFWFDPI